MCTVTWVLEEDGYQLLCNRDEKRTRAQAVAPRVQIRNGVRFIAPIDGDFGGTWIGANEFGVTVCLLNGTNRNAGTGRSSRGLLLIDLLTARSVTEVYERTWENDLSDFAPFTLAALERGRDAAIVGWNGVDKATLPHEHPVLTSSSFDPGGVGTRRRDDFLRRLNSNGKLDAGLLFAFHGSHGPGADAYSTCMHRPDAETVSFSWIKVTGSMVDFFYTPAAPCKWAAGETQKLPLRGGFSE